MTKEQVQDRIKQLESERDQVKANLLAYEGAIQDCNYWLQQLEVQQEVEHKPVEETKIEEKE